MSAIDPTRNVSTNAAIASRLNGAKGGGPRGSKTLISHAMVKHLCLRKFRKHVRFLEDIAANSDNPQARIAAICVRWERGLGKVPQAHTGEGGGPITLQVVSAVERSEGFGDWGEQKAIAPPE